MSNLLSLCQDLGIKLGAGLTPVLAWWWRGLLELFPRLDQLTTAREQSSLLIIRADKTRVVLADGTTTDFPTLFGDTAPDAFRTLRDLNKHLLVSLAPEQLLRLPMRLPKMSAGKLREAVAFRLLTECPLARDEVYFDLRALADRDGFAVEVVLCRRETVAHALAALEQAGLAVAAVGFAETADGGLNFVFYNSPDREAALSTSKQRGWLWASLAGLVLGFAPLLHGTAAWLEYGVRREAQTAQSQFDARAGDLARRAFIASVREEFARQLPHTGLVTTLNDIARTLPKTAWITLARYDGAVLHLTGHAPDAAGIIRELGKLPGIAEAKLVAVAGANLPGLPPQFEALLTLAETPP